MFAETSELSLPFLSGESQNTGGVVLGHWTGIRIDESSRDDVCNLSIQITRGTRLYTARVPSPRRPGHSQVYSVQRYGVTGVLPLRPDFCT